MFLLKKQTDQQQCSFKLKQTESETYLLMGEEEDERKECFKKKKKKKMGESAAQQQCFKKMRNDSQNGFERK